MCGPRAEIVSGPVQNDGMSSLSVEVENLVKRYPKRDVNAVDDITFAVPRGELFGLLGPNGAGKSTTIGVLTTRVIATSGHARVAGIDVITDPVAARTKLAVVPQRVNLDRSLTARQNLLFHAAYHGVPKGQREKRADEVLEQFGLGDRGGDKVDKFSGGQSQRLMIARALMHFPQVLFLDEPSTGLDPQARLFVWDRVRELKQAGVTIVLTTHDMDEAEQLCDRVAIIDHGRLLAMDTPGALTRSVPGDTTINVAVTLPSDEGTDKLLARFEEITGVGRVEQLPTDEGVRAKLFLDREPAAVIAALSEVVNDLGVHIVDLAFGRTTLEDVFISMTGRGLR
jgi:ABC-2 type transport system ATP-binding protein